MVALRLCFLYNRSTNTSPPSDIRFVNVRLRHLSQQPLLVPDADIIPLMYLSEIGSRSTGHVERPTAVTSDDLNVAAADVDDRPLLRGTAVLVPLPDRRAVSSCAPLHVEHLAAMTRDDLVIAAANRNDLKLLVGPTAAAELYGHRAGGRRSAVDVDTLARVPGDDLVIRCGTLDCPRTEAQFDWTRLEPHSKCVRCSIFELCGSCDPESVVSVIA